jgi:lipopolysaccharide export system permease protein
MKILDRYIAKTLFKYSSSVMVILVGVFAFFKFLEEVGDIGKADYNLIDALIYIGLTLPSIVYLLFSLIILLGVILSLGYFASNSELIIMRNSGMSIVDITKSSLKISLFFALIMIIIGEFAAPISSDYAKKYRAEALGQKTLSVNQQGFWIKDDKNIIHVERNIDGHIFNQVTVIKIKNSKQLDSVIYSDKANFNGKTIELQNPNKYQINSSKPIAVINKQLSQKHIAKVTFDKELIQSLKRRPKELSTWQLFKQVGYLSSNNLSSGKYEVELYSRLMKPLTLIAMIILSIPFVFGSLRDASLGKKIFLGIVISLFFQLMSNITAQFSLLYNLNHLLVASMPTLVVFVIALFNLRRISST